MDMKDNYVVGMGEVLWDVFGDSKRLGGAPANFAYHASRFGHEGLVVSAIGNDTDGDDIVAELDRKRLTHHLEHVDFHTGTVDVDLSDVNNPVYTINTDVSWCRIPFTEELAQIAANTKAVCFKCLPLHFSISHGQAAAQRPAERRRHPPDFRHGCHPRASDSLSHSPGAVHIVEQ